MASPHVLVVEARFYDDLSDALYHGATAHLQAMGASWERLQVPGAFEIPAAIGFAAGSPTGRFDGFIALGCVIRGETTHYDYVCSESARGLMNLTVQRGLAIGYGILTTENAEQAWARADPARKNKGRDAAAACLAMIEVRRRYSGA